MIDDRMFFHFHNLQDDFIKYYQSTNKHRIDQIKLSRLSILYGASVLNRRIRSIFQNQCPEKIVICAHLKHSKIHDFYIIAASLIYGYTIFHSNWHLDGDESLVYKLKITKCNLVILDDDLDSVWMLPGVKYVKISDIYTPSIYNKSLSLCNYLTLVDSMGKERSDSRIQAMLNDQTNHVSRIREDDVFMISFTEGKANRKPNAKMITFAELYKNFKELESLNMWKDDDILVVLITNPTYDWLTSTILYYCLYRPKVYIHFLERYMSTYWKILWEANEHAKNVFLQLGKSYKILNFLYTRQLEALFTLEEVSNECLLFTGDHKLRDILNENVTDAFGGDKNEDTATNANSSSGQCSTGPSNVSKSILARGKNLVTDQFTKPDHSSNFNDDSALKYDNLNTPTLRNPLVYNPLGANLAPASLRNQSSPQLEQGKRSKTSVYIPKLHLKFSELRGALSDKNVHFFLSGTHTYYDLCETFHKIFGGKLPLAIYGCNEINPIMTIVSPELGVSNVSELYKRGVDNVYNGKPQLGYYIGTSKQPCLAIVKSLNPSSGDFLVKCDEGEPGFFVCKISNKEHLLLSPEVHELLLEDGTYLGIDDAGFYYKTQGEEEHFFWSYNINCSITKDLSYPYDMLMATSRAIQKSICVRYGLTTPVVRVETMKLQVTGKESRIITAVELITVLKADITQDIGSGFLNTCKSVGLFSKYLEPNEIRVISMPWTYKGSVNYPILRVRA